MFWKRLLNMGMKGCRVAIIGENRYEWVVSYLSTVNGIGVAVPIDRMLPPNEIESMLERSGAEVLYIPKVFRMLPKI